MAKKSYIGIDGVARKIKKWYVGVDNKARKVKKAYIGVGGVARPFFSSETNPVYYGQLGSTIDTAEEAMFGATLSNSAIFLGNYGHYMFNKSLTKTLLNSNGLYSDDSRTTLGDKYAMSVCGLSQSAGTSTRAYKRTMCYNTNGVLQYSDGVYGIRNMISENMGNSVLIAGGYNDNGNQYNCNRINENLTTQFIGWLDTTSAIGNSSVSASVDKYCLIYPSKNSNPFSINENGVITSMSENSNLTLKVGGSYAWRSLRTENYALCYSVNSTAYDITYFNKNLVRSYLTNPFAAKKTFFSSSPYVTTSITKGGNGVDAGDKSLFYGGVLTINEVKYVVLDMLTNNLIHSYIIVPVTTTSPQVEGAGAAIVGDYLLLVGGNKYGSSSFGSGSSYKSKLVTAFTL